MLVCSVWRLSNPPINPREDRLISSGIKSIEAGQFDRAYRSIRRALSLNPSNPISIELLEIVGLRWLPKVAPDIKDPVLNFKRLIDKYPESPYIKIVGAEVLLFEGDTDNAKNLINEVFVDRSDIPQGWFVLGSILQAEGNTESAIVSLRRATELKPQEQYFTKLGELYFINEDWELCVDNQRIVLTQYKLRLPSKIIYLRCLFYTGQFSEALVVGKELKVSLSSESRVSKRALYELNSAISSYSSENRTNLSKEQLFQYTDIILSVARKLNQSNFLVSESSTLSELKELQSILEYDLKQVRKLFGSSYSL